jgi:hypothetical protein
MASAYTKPILRFGLATPVLFNCVLVAVVFFCNSKLSQVRDQKEKRYKEQVARLAAIKALQAELAPKRKAFDDQKILLQSDPGQLFTRVLDTLLPKYQDFELERTGLVFPLDRGRIGRQLQIDAARVKSSFEGGFGPMQEALLQVESLMPQATVEEIKITRKADALLNKPDHLAFEVTHTCWKGGTTKP